MTSFDRLVRRAVEQTAVPRLLLQHPAIVLERVARAAGATRWFRITSDHDLQLLYERLAPGSTVSFYFDDRIAPHLHGDETVALIMDLVASHGDAVVGTLCADGLNIYVQFVAGANELGEVTEGLAPGSHLFVGAFPEAGNDGRNAVTVVLPDADGMTRVHPH